MMSLSESLKVRALCSLLAFVAGFGVVRSGREPLKSGATSSEAPEAARVVPPEIAGVARRPAPSATLPENDASEADDTTCDAERRATLEYGVRAARAEILTRYGRPPATSLLPPSEEEIEAVFPDALATLVSCTPPPCRLSVASRTMIDDFKSVPEQWGYPYGEVRAGSGRDGVLVYEFAFVGNELSPHEWKFVRNAWSTDGVRLDEMLLDLRDVDHE